MRGRKQNGRTLLPASPFAISYSYDFFLQHKPQLIILLHDMVDTCAVASSSQGRTVRHRGGATLLLRPSLSSVLPF